MQGVRCIYIAPLKGLINDQELRIEIFASECLLTVQKWHGDVPRGQKGWVYGEAPTFLLITPESLEVLLCEPGLIPDLKSLKFKKLLSLEDRTGLSSGQFIPAEFHKIPVSWD